MDITFMIALLAIICTAYSVYLILSDRPKVTKGEIFIKASMSDGGLDIDHLNNAKFDSIQITTKEGKKITLNNMVCEAKKIDGEDGVTGIQFESANKS